MALQPVRKNTFIGEYFVQQGVLTPEELSIALREQKVGGNEYSHERLGEILIRLGFARRQQVIEALSVINPDALAEDISGQETNIPAAFLLKHKTIIKGDTGSTLFISTMSDDPFGVRDELAKITRREVRLVPTSVVDIVARLARGQQDIQESNRQDLYLEEDVNNMIISVLNEAIHRRATDIHIETAERTTHIRYRIDGVLYDTHSINLAQSNKFLSRMKDMSGMDVSEKRKAQDGEFSHTYRGRSIECRVATLPAYYGEKCTVRILDRDSIMLDIGTLGIKSIDKWTKLAHLRNGLILVCGATGSGKTTTLYSTLQYLDGIHKAIYTIEDPVEYKLPFVTQTKVNRDIGLDFASFTRTVLRHDPDVVIVGEVRDSETAGNAMHLADTGHLVYATLHTNDIPQTLASLENRLGVDLFHLAFILRGVLVQQLARKLCVNCGGSGCDECDQSGYRGMTLISEFAEFHELGDVKKMLEGKLEYQTLNEDIVDKVSSGITDCKEVRRVTGRDVYLCQSSKCVSGKPHCSNALVAGRVG